VKLEIIDDKNDIQNKLKINVSDKRAPKVNIAESASKMTSVQNIRYCVHR